MKKKFSSESVYQIIIHLIIALVVCVSIFPLLYVVGMSLTTLPEMMKRHYFVIIPHSPTFEAYKRLLVQGFVWNSLGISAFRSIVGTFMTLCMTTMGAYVLARKSLPGRKIFLFLVLTTILFNGGMIPTYLVINKLHLINKIWALIVPLMIDSFGLLAIKVFISNLPEEIMESAKIDGTGDFQLFIRIVVPLTIPSIIAIGMFNIVIHWNSWFDALLYVQGNKDLYPFQYFIRNYFIAVSAADNALSSSNSQRVTTDTLKMAAVIIGVFPILCSYPFFQKYFTKGVFMGAVKG